MTLSQVMTPGGQIDIGNANSRPYKWFDVFGLMVAPLDDPQSAVLYLTLRHLMTVGGQILFILLPALMFAKLVYEDVTTIIRVKLPNLKEVIVFIIGLVILTPLLQSYLYIQNFVIDLIASKVTVLSKLKEMLDKLDEVVTQAYADLLSGTSIFEVFFVVIVVAVVPSLCEEVFFRGYVQKSFELRIKPFWAALITAVFFGMYHFNPYGLPALIALGLFFGFAAYKSNSIVIPLMLHFLNNLIAIIAYYILGEEEFIQGNVKDPSAIGTNLFLFIFFLALFLVYIYLLIRNYHKINRS